MSSNYEQTVRRMAELKADEFISNGMYEHAASLYKVFFETAKNSIVLLCHNFKEEVFDRPDVIDAFKGAVDRGVNFAFIVQESSDNTFRKAVEARSQKRPAQVRLFDASKAVGDKAKLVAKSAVNFCVVDRTAFRWEEDRGKCEAVASMNMPKTASKMADLFEDYLSAVSPKTS